jgi:poly(3-hydroxyalkanoate) depolymerase
MSKPLVEFVEVDGVNLRVATQRSNEKGKNSVPLLLFNGIGANLELCFPFMEAMPEKEILIFDVPGIGRSQMSWRPRRFSGLASLANKLLDRLGYREVDVIGVSWGGALAQQFARQYSKRCRRLVLAATSTGAIMVPGKPSVLAKIATPRRYFSPGYMQKAAGEIYGGETRRNPKVMSAHTSRIIPPQFMGYVYQLLAGMGWTSIHWLHRIRQPTLVMAGAEDPLVPAVNSRIISFLIPNNRLHIVPGGGHLFMLYSIDKVVPVIRGFLDSDVPLTETYRAA